MAELSEESPVYAPFFGVMGAASAIIFSVYSEKLSARKREGIVETLKLKL